MSLNDAIGALNELSKDVFSPRPRKGFSSHITLSYPAEKTVEEHAKNVSKLMKEEEWTDDDVAKLTCSSMIALMADPFEMSAKVPLLDIVIRWVSITSAEMSMFACILQSLRVSDIHFNDVYAIRTTMFNYVTMPGVKNETILEVLPTGKIELQPRETDQFDGNVSNQHIFVLLKLQKIVSNYMPIMFSALTQYDFGRCADGERSHQITKPLSNYQTSGFSIMKEKGQSCFASDFGKVTIPDVEEVFELKSHDHNSALENYRNATRWLKKFEKERLDEELRKRFEFSSESSESTDEEEQWSNVRDSTTAESSSESDKSDQSDSDSSESPSPIGIARSFFTGPLPKIMKVRA